MPINRKLKTILICLPLLLGTLAGAPMAPEEIENLLHATHQHKIAYVLEDEEEDGDSGLGKTPEDLQIESTSSRPQQSTPCSLLVIPGDNPSG
jgi:hypothetical protein